MSVWEILQAVVLGVVEGLTEFLPISSTGHLIIASDWIGFAEHPYNNTFVVVIQAGAILAVCWYYRALISQILKKGFRSGSERRLVVNTLVAFLPAAVVGFICAGFIKNHFFNITTVATMLIVGGVILLWIEKRAVHSHQAPKVAAMEDLTPGRAFLVGVAQCFAMIPGTSRSGSTIIGGLLLGLSRKAATEFSFFLAIPTIFGATIYDLWRDQDALLSGEMPWGLLGIGIIVSFFSALALVKWLIGFVGRNDYRVFGWYRIIFGVALFVASWLGWISF